MILIVGVSICFILVAYVGYVFFQKRASLHQVNRVSIEFKRPPSAANNNQSPSKAISAKPIDENGQQDHVSPTVSSYIRNRNQSRFSSVTYISPKSMYGHMPKTNILSDRNKPKELKKEFTVKLSSFPQVNRSIRSPNVTLSSPSESKSSFNHSTLNGSVTHKIDLPRNDTTLARPSNKRPMFSSDDGECEQFSKKSKNHFETIDLDDDDDMFEDAVPEVNSVPIKKAVKRSTLSFENEMALNSPQKRVKNNEILSSYSSTSVTRNLANKRKYSPEESSANTKIKKRTYIEELELLNSDLSPYFRDSSPKISSSNNLALNDDTALNSVPTVPPKSFAKPTLLSSDATKQTNSFQISKEDNLTDQIILDDDDTEDTNMETNLDEGSKKSEDRFYPIPAHIFSIKDHEYDKKKSKNRLDRFLAAVQQASDINENNNIQSSVENEKFNDVVDSSANVTSTSASAISFASTANTLSTISSDSIASKSTVAPITTTIVLSDETKSSESQLKSILKLPTVSVPLVSTSVLSTSTFNPPTNSVVPIKSDLTKSISTNAISTPASSSIFSVPIQTSAVTIDSKPQSTLNFNFSSINSNALAFPATITSSNNSFSSGLQSNQPSTGFQPVSKPNIAIQPQTQADSVVTNVSSNSNIIPKLLFNTTSSTLNPSSINNSSIPTTNSSQITFVPSQPSQPTSNFSSLSNQSANEQVKPPASVFNFGQPQAVKPKPSFDFTQIKPIALNTSSPAPSSTTFTLPSNNLPSFAFNASSNLVANSNSLSNGIKTVPNSAQNLPSLNTTSAFTFNAAPPSLNSNNNNNMFSFNASTPRLASNSNPKEATNGVNMKPSVSFDFKAAPSSNLASNGGFNFSTVASSMTNPGFNFGQPSSSNSTPFSFNPASNSSSITSPPAAFAFGASNSATPMFQFNSK